MIQTLVTALVAILALSAAASLISQRLLIPWVTQLALAGAVVGVLLRDRLPTIEPSLILIVFLPGLLFEAAFNLDWGRLRHSLVAVVLMATVGVALTTSVTAGLAHLVLGLPVATAVLFGAAVAATDPVAVVATFRRLGVPARLRNLMEAESLLNDGTGVVVFTVALAVATSHVMSAGTVVLDLLWLTIGGISLGAALGALLSRITGHIDDPQVELTLTALAAYGGYLAGEAIHVSGILTVVAAGLVMGNYGRARNMTPRTQNAVEAVWDYLAFVLNSAIFVLIGAAVPLQLLLKQLPLVAAGVGIVLLSRAVTVYGLLNLLRPLGVRTSWRWQHLLIWGGLRGAVAVALVLSLPSDLPDADAIRALVYGVVLSSIVVQGTTIVPLTRLLIPQGRIPQARPVEEN